MKYILLIFLFACNGPKMTDRYKIIPDVPDSVRRDSLRSVDSLIHGDGEDTLIIRHANKKSDTIYVHEAEPIHDTIFIFLKPNGSYREPEPKNPYLIPM